MSRPVLLVFARDKKTSMDITEQLKNIFEERINIDYKYLEDELPEHFDNVNMVLVTSQSYTRIVVPRVKTGTDIMVVRRTLTVESLNKLQNIAPDTKALLVNDKKEAAEETIALIYELGIKNLHLTPVYPGLKEIPYIDFAITPDEISYVPENINNVLNIGPRVIDISTITDIAIKFNLMNEIGNNILPTHLTKIIPNSLGLKDTLQKMTNIRQKMETILNTVNDGVLAYDKAHNITQFNRVMEQLSGKAHWQIMGKPVKNIFSHLDLPLEILNNKKSFYDRVYSVMGKKYLISKMPFDRKETSDDYILTFKETSQIEKQELKVRKELRKKGLLARYSFNDIIGTGPTIKKTINHARKLTRGDSEVLIQGESGTGKELFAQSIHNASKRNNGPFVAINCSALPESLLESELFGYEEGAFTGAKKGGKPGLFEQAHKGTIFLDEIGDLPLSLQSRLLRVLQEKEIMRIGAIKIIPVDIRVISATNRNLTQLIEKNLFRADLYYRLNVLPLHIPPLRERLEDLPLLVNYFLARAGDKRHTSREIMNYLREYSWPGNVRELNNCIKYMINISDEEFKIKDLPPYILDNKTPGKKKEGLSPSSNNIKNIVHFILKQLYISARTGNGMGRYKLYQIAREKGYNISKSKIRTELKHLKDKNLIKTISRRSGHTISKKGVKLLNRLENINL